MNAGLTNIVTLATNQNKLSRKAVVLPGSTQSLITDQDSRVYDSSTRDYYKGKSFVFTGKWKTGTHYFCDEYVQDWVSYDGLLLICKKSHLSTDPPEIVIEHGMPVSVNSEYWDLVILTNTKRYVFVYEQTEESKVWHIEHDLNTFPSVTIVNNDNEEIKGEIVFNDVNNITVSFSEPLTGKVYLG